MFVLDSGAQNSIAMQIKIFSHSISIDYQDFLHAMYLGLDVGRPVDNLHLQL